jgi:diguanylate cyclase (GGDEF)-like protein
MGSLPDINARRILLTGDISRAFLDFNAAEKLSCEICNNMLDAIEATAKKHFELIAIVISGTSANFGSALKAIRQVSVDARIVLLAQMYEEPLAIKFVHSTQNGKTLADDYLICPLLVEQFLKAVRAGSPKGAYKSDATVVVDAKIGERIKQLEKLATEDELTGLKNRRYIWEFARQIINRAKEQSGKVTLLVYDIDDFKHYNDVYGHWAGDEILKQAAVLMRRCCRGHDVVGRVGGDEFAVVFWDDPLRKSAEGETERRSLAAEPPKEAIFIAERFRKELQKAELSLLGPEGKGVLAISGGLASFPRDGQTVTELFKQADVALLEAKRSGKNRIYLVGKPESNISEIR